MGEWDQPETHSDRHITPLGHGVPPRLAGDACFAVFKRLPGGDKLLE